MDTLKQKDVQKIMKKYIQNNLSCIYVLSLVWFVWKALLAGTSGLTSIEVLFKKHGSVSYKTWPLNF
jgi:uncharacterized membrane protein